MPKTKKRAKRSIRSINRPAAWLTAAAVVIVLLAIYFLARPSSPSANSQASDNGAGSQKPAVTAPKNSSSESHSQVAQGGAKDNQGSDVAQTPANDWTSSANGLITLKSPVSDAVLKSGDIISGTAKLGAVQYRLIDDQVGVLAQGPLSVVNGKFSGKIQFRPQASTGSLDIFSYSQDGSEINRLTVKVKLGS